MGFTNCSVGESRTWSPEDVWCQLTSDAVESHQFTSTRGNRSIRHCPSVTLRMRRLHATTTPATQSGDRSTRCNKCCCPRFRNRKNLAGKPAKLCSVNRRCGTAGTSAQCHHRKWDRGTGIRGNYVMAGAEDCRLVSVAARRLPAEYFRMFHKKHDVSIVFKLPDAV